MGIDMEELGELFDGTAIGDMAVEFFNIMEIEKLKDGHRKAVRLSEEIDYEVKE